MNNTLKYYLYVVFGGIYALTTTGAVLQTFMLENGYTEVMTNVFFSVMNIVQVLSILVLTGVASKVRKTRIWMRNLYLLAFPFAIMLTVMCYFPSAAKLTALLYLLGAIYNVAVGVQGVLSYKLPISLWI